MTYPEDLSDDEITCMGLSEKDSEIPSHVYDGIIDSTAVLKSLNPVFQKIFPNWPYPEKKYNLTWKF